MANPALTEKRFKQAATELDAGWASPAGAGGLDGSANPPVRATTATMSANGTFAKAFVLWALILAGGVVGWQQFSIPAFGTIRIPGWAWGLMAAAFGLAIVTIFVPKVARFTAPLYAIAEGVFLGVISKFYDTQWSGIVLQAVLATVAVFLVCLVLYVTGVVKVTRKFIFVVVAATAGIMVMYLATFLLDLVGADISFWREPSGLGIAFSVGICIVAALNLFVDFEFIRRMVAAGEPKAMEWYGAFGLTLTIVWLYVEILRLLSYLRD